MPYQFFEVGEEPGANLLRRGDIIRWIGVRENMFDKIVVAGILPWKRVLPTGNRMYKKEDVKRVFLEGFRSGRDDADRLRVSRKHSS